MAGGTSDTGDTGDTGKSDDTAGESWAQVTDAVSDAPVDEPTDPTSESEEPGARRAFRHDDAARDTHEAPGARLAEEARRLAESLAAQAGLVREQVVEPLLRKHPEVAAHLTAAGSELVSAYRAFVADRERRWAARPAPTERITLDDTEDGEDPESAGDTGGTGDPR